jgi:uncharacterized protein (DUF1501 family)
MRIWQTARFDEEEHDGYGWLGRALDLPEPGSNGVNAGQPGAIYTGSDSVPVALWGRRSAAMSMTTVADLKLPFTASQLTATDRLSHASAQPDMSDLDMFVTRQVLSAYTAADQFQRQGDSTVAAAAAYPTTQLATQLKLISQLIKSDSRARVYYTVQGGYDTHAAQLYTHAQLLGEFSSGLKAFLDDVKNAGLDDRIVVLAFSEFGRRVKENASEGTDHGAAGPVFLAGAPCAGGLVGTIPNLTDLDDGDLKHQIDMRQVYAAILEDWLDVDASAVLAGTFSKLPILRL